MTWRERSKRLYEHITTRVMKHDAPVEVIQEVEQAVYGGGIQYHSLLSRYIADHIDLIMNEPYWPKNERRTAVICPVTGESTTHPFGLSGRAWELINKGVDYELLVHKQNADKYYYCFHGLWGSGMLRNYSIHKTEDGYNIPYKPVYGTGSEHWWRMYDPLFALLGVKHGERHLPYDKSPEDMGWIWLPYEPFDIKLVSQGKLEVVLLTQAQAEIVRSVITQTQWEMEEKVRAAKLEGSNLLLELAQGTESVEKFNAVRDLK